jgi:hypothetical protein
MNEPRPGLPGPKVSFASIWRWGTEPEGWYVDLPYAVFIVAGNYSPIWTQPLCKAVSLVDDLNRLRPYIRPLGN